MWQYIVAFIGSLVAALIAVWVSLRWSAKSRNQRAVRSLWHELATNVTILGYICENLDKETEWAKEEKHGITPFARLHTSAWDMARSAIVLSDHVTSSKLEAAYIAADIINSYIHRIEDLKYGPIATARNIKELKQQNFAALRSYIMDVATPALREAWDIIDKELSKYKWWHL